MRAGKLEYTCEYTRQLVQGGAAGDLLAGPAGPPPPRRVWGERYRGDRGCQPPQVAGRRALELKPGRERNLAEAKERESSVREQREAIEEQIEALKRALAVKLEEERRCKEELQSAQTLLQMFLDAESSKTETLRTDRGRVT